MCLHFCVKQLLKDVIWLIGDFPQNFPFVFWILRWVGWGGSKFFRGGHSGSFWQKCNTPCFLPKIQNLNILHSDSEMFFFLFLKFISFLKYYTKLIDYKNSLSKMIFSLLLYNIRTIYYMVLYFQSFDFKNQNLYIFWLSY